MATIRLGNGGQAVPGRAPQISTPAAGMGVAQALTDLGRTAGNAALSVIAEETQRQRAQDEAVRRAQEGAALHETQDKLRDLHDQIGEQMLSGQLARDQAETTYNEQARKVIDESLPKFREDSRALVAPRLQSDLSTLGNSMRRMVEKRGKQEVSAAITQSLEYFERLYPTDRAKAETGVSGLLQAMGPFSDMTPEQLTKLGQGWKERTQFGVAQRTVNAARRSNAELDAAAKALDDPQFADIDPTRKGQLLTQIEGYRVANAQRAEADARRREAEQERKLRKAEHYMKAAESIFVSGRPLSQEFAAEVSNGVSGTPYAESFRNMMVEAKEGTAFALRPLAQQQAILQQMRQDLNKGSNPRAEERYAKFVRTNAEVEKAYKADPIQAGADYGLIQLEPLPLTDLNNLGPALVARGQQASLVSQQTGRPVSPFTAQEAEQVGQLLMTLPAADRSRYVASISAAVGPQTAGAVAQQIDKKDRALGLAFAMAGSATTNGRLTSELVLKGAQAKKDGSSTKGEKEPDVKAARWKATAAASLADVFPVQTMTDATVDAAEFIMHGIAAENGGRLTQRDMERAVELAIGGKLIEHNGRKTPLPAGIDTDTFEKRLRTVTVEEIVKQSLRPVQKPPQMIEPGNIDLSKRPSVKNSDGTISTIESMSENIDGVEVLFPTIAPDGTRMTEQQAVERYKKTGEHLGKFSDPKAADAYARALSDEQNAYFVRAGGAHIPVADFVKTLPGSELIYAGPGRYSVLVKGRPVTRPDGSRVIIKVTQ